ncbi:hypothetical protein [Streptomyces mirabilis]|uniref:hypothetical protein n=1 Tax=Streptomyces mirabilis TaxID=68239 RepID=UPI003253D3AE
MTLVVLRFQLPHQVLTELHDTSRSAAAYVGGLLAYADTYDSGRRRSQRLTRPGWTGGPDMQGADGTSSPQRRETLEEMPAISHCQGVGVVCLGALVQTIRRSWHTLSAPECSWSHAATELVSA